MKNLRGFRVVLVLAFLAVSGTVLAGTAVAQDPPLVKILVTADLPELPPGADTLAVGQLTIAPGVSYTSAGTPEIDLTLVKEGAITLEGGSGPITVNRGGNVTPEPVETNASTTLNAGDGFALPNCTTLTMKNEGTAPTTLFVGGIVNNTMSGCPDAASSSAGLPDGVEISLIQTFPVTEWPPIPAVAAVATVRYDAGMSAPGNPDPGPTAAYIDSGSFEYTLKSGNAWLAKGGDLATAVAGDGPTAIEVGKTITLSAGDVIFETTGTVSDVSNTSSEPATAIGIILAPGAVPLEEGTPAA